MPPKLTTSEFIKRANKIHSNKYNYSKVDYKFSNHKIIIICPEHGEFTQRPGDHILRHQGCPKCAGNLKLSVDNFIKRANKIHSNKYDYSKVIYNGGHSKVKIICPEHGEFLQEANSHLRGHKCKKCSQIEIEKRNLKKYGVSNQSKLDSVKAKVKQTCLRKYGYAFVSAVPKFKKKREKTNIRNWQVKNVFQSPKIIENFRKNWHNTKKKIIKNNRIKYGVDYPAQTKISKRNLIEKWPYTFQKIKNTNLKKYGVNNISQSHIKNMQFFNHDFLLENFLDTDKTILIDDMMQFFNISRKTCYTLMYKFNVNFIPKKGNFNPDKPAILYYLYDPEENLYKIGITNRTIEERFGKAFCSNRAIAILEQTHFKNGIDALNAEQEILEAFNYARCTNSTWPKEVGGRTEFFKEDVLRKHTKNDYTK